MSNWKNVGPPVEINQELQPRTYYPRPYYPYPVEYDARIHGPYDPARNYGPEKPRLWNIKLGELPGFLLRANWKPRNLINHSYHWFARWYRDNLRCAKTPIMPIFQAMAFTMVYLMVARSGYIPMSRGGYKTERMRKYHW